MEGKAGLWPVWKMCGRVHKPNPNHQTDESGGVDDEPDDRGSHHFYQTLFPVVMPRGTSYAFHQNDDIFKAILPALARIPQLLSTP